MQGNMNVKLESLFSFRLMFRLFNPMDYVALNMKVDGEYVRIWNVTVLAYLQELSWLIETTKISVSIASRSRFMSRTF